MERVQAEAPSKKRRKPEPSDDDASEDEDSDEEPLAKRKKKADKKPAPKRAVKRRAQPDRDARKVWLSHLPHAVSMPCCACGGLKGRTSADHRTCADWQPIEFTTATIPPAVPKESTGPLRAHAVLCGLA